MCACCPGTGKVVCTGHVGKCRKYFMLGRKMAMDLFVLPVAPLLTEVYKVEISSRISGDCVAKKTHVHRIYGFNQP